MTEAKPGFPRRLITYKVITVILLVILTSVTLVSYTEIQSLQAQLNQLNNLKQTGLSVVSGKVVTSTDNLANVPYASVIMFDDGFYKVNSTIMQQHYTTYLIDGLGYYVIVQFSNKTLCNVGEFTPSGTVVFHDFSAC